MASKKITINYFYSFNKFKKPGVRNFVAFTLATSPKAVRSEGANKSSQCPLENPLADKNRQKLTKTAKTGAFGLGLCI